MLGCDRAGEVGSIPRGRMAIPFCFAGVLAASWAISRSFGAGESLFAASKRKQNPPQSSEWTEESV